jgi:hypothetical protein
MNSTLSARNCSTDLVFFIQRLIPRKNNRKQRHSVHAGLQRTELATALAKVVDTFADSQRQFGA